MKDSFYLAVPTACVIAGCPHFVGICVVVLCAL